MKDLAVMRVYARTYVGKAKVFFLSRNSKARLSEPRVCGPRSFAKSTAPAPRVAVALSCTRATFTSSQTEGVWLFPVHHSGSLLHSRDLQ